MLGASRIGAQPALAPQPTALTLSELSAVTKQHYSHFRVNPNILFWAKTTVVLGIIKLVAKIVVPARNFKCLPVQITHGP